MNYEVKPITYEECKEWLLYKHYAKRMSLISYSFGLFDSNECVGICTFGLASPKINGGKSLFHNIECRVIELNRLVTNENLKKNSLSWFVARCLKLIPNDVVVISFADPFSGHNGYIYQATNWIYTGLSEKGGKMKNYFFNGVNIHSLTISEKWFGKFNYTYDKSKSLDENFLAIGGSIESFGSKHRYIYINFNKKKKKKMLDDLKVKILPYPKGDNKRYDASFKPNTQTKLF